ncbi:hydrogenase iron-sulfur subunit [Candidatus Sumerlaeota bacterium]|nr:hydrogenase iron-sulfur subunit [Candidatus Sumerlaeota bacterium]
MSENAPRDDPKILIHATSSCAYPGADATGQARLSYSANTHIINVPSPAVFPDEFHYRCFEKVIGGIIVMSCGEECPYPGVLEQLAARLDRDQPKHRCPSGPRSIPAMAVARDHPTGQSLSLDITHPARGLRQRVAALSDSPRSQKEGEAPTGWGCLASLRGRTRFRPVPAIAAMLRSRLPPNRAECDPGPP